MPPFASRAIPFFAEFCISIVNSTHIKTKHAGEIPAAGERATNQSAGAQSLPKTKTHCVPATPILITAHWCTARSIRPRAGLLAATGAGKSGAGEIRTAIQKVLLQVAL